MNTPILFRRHRPACAAKHRAGSFSTEVDERKRGFVKCDCKIYIHGTLQGVSKRLATGVRDWDSARAVLAPYLAAGSWDVTGLPTPPPPSPDQGPVGGTPPDPAPRTEKLTPIADAIKHCLKDVEESGSAKNTMRNYRGILGQFQCFSDQNGLRFLEEWKPAIVRQFRNTWDVRQSTRRKKLGLLKAFFELFVEDLVLESNPARIKIRQNVVTRKGEDEESEPRNPFTDAEVERMRAACDNYGRDFRAWPRTGEMENGHKGRVLEIAAYKQYRRTITGDDLRDFMDISRSTGLRIGDVATFHASRLKSNGEVKVRPQKNGNWVSVPVQEWVAEIIRRRERTVGPLIFGKHATSDLNTITDQWRRKLNRVWASSGPWAQKPTHHRFRHTFIRVCLEHGMTAKDVGDLVGDTESTIERHYSQWMPERQASLSSRMRKAFGGLHQA